MNPFSDVDLLVQSVIIDENAGMRNQFWYQFFNDADYAWVYANHLRTWTTV